MKPVAFAATLAVALLGCVSPLLATPITYSEAVTATGSLGASPFTNALVTITLTGDTANVTGFSTFLNPGVATVAVSGLGTATFTDADLRAVDNQALARAGISDFTLGRAILFTDNLVFATYDLKSPIGPNFGPAAFNPNSGFPTTLGNFSLASISGNSSFTATTVPTVPEPTSLLLLGTGFVGVVARCSRRKRASPTVRKK
jgi:PEP-CTERM motif